MMGRKRAKARNKTDSSKDDTINQIDIEGTENVKSREDKTCYLNELDDTLKAELFPHWLPWILFPLLLLLRISYVLDPTNWWILHPDEIFQTMEVAHTEAFGYGFRPYEYLSPPRGINLNSAMFSAAHKQELQLGMYSLRSFILPKLLSVVLCVADMSGIEVSPFLIVKIFHVTVTSLLPLAVFQFSQRLHRSKDIGCLSAILVSTSTSLNVFGTHSTINSFLSPFVFLSLVPFLQIIHPSLCVHLRKVRHSSGFGRLFPWRGFYEYIFGNFSETYVQKQIDAFGRKSEDNGENLLDQPNEHVYCHDENANIISPKVYQNINATNKSSNMLSHIREGQTSTTIIEIWNHFIIKLPFCVFSLHEYFSGLILAICIYIRPSLILIPSLLALCFSSHTLHNISNLSKLMSSYVFGFVTGILIGGYCDYVTYGSWFLAPYQWFRFNVWNGFAGGIFGSTSINFYIIQLYQKEPLVALYSLIIISDMILSLLSGKVQQHDGKTGVMKHHSFVLFVLLLLLFSLNTHKEFRFIQNAIVFMHIATSRAIISLHKYFKSLSNQNNYQYSIYVIYLFIVLFVSSHYYQFLNVSVKERTNWTYARNVDSHETNICLDFIRQQKDVTGVFMDRSLQMSGAYSILHHDVPIFALNIFEYIEYRKLPSSMFNMIYGQESGHSKGLSTFTDINDFIHIRNPQYLVKVLLTKPEYNYFILRTSQNFVDIGYSEVFRAGNAKVLRRQHGEEVDTDLQNTARKIRMNLNATVLEYEGYKLKHFGLYVKAEERLILANRVDPKRIGVFRLLLCMYKDLNVSKSFTKVLKACEQLYNKTDCLKPYVPIMINRGYHRTILT